MTGDGLVHRLAVLRTIRRHGRDLTLGRLKQRRQLTGIIGGILGKLAGHAPERNGLAAAGLLAPAPCTNASLGHKANELLFRFVLIRY